MMMDSIRIFSPATVANVSCGYDAMGFALDTLGDDMVFTKTANKTITITKIEGAKLPYECHKNAASAVAKLLLDECQADFGLNIEIYKNFKPGSGLGSSAASASGAAFAVNELLGRPYSNLELVKFAMQGEIVACGSAIADNVAACLYGGFILVRSYEPLDIVSIPTPDELFATIIHPQIEIKTEDARAIVPKTIPVKTAIKQWANVGGLISGLYEKNYETIGNSLQDLVAEPYRKQLIPHFDDVKKVSLKAGALGFGISGSGPSMFTLNNGETTAIKVAKAMTSVYNGTGIAFNIHKSQIAKKGVRIV